MPQLFIVGVGPGIGRAVALRFAREGFDIGLVARSQNTLESVTDALGALEVNTVGVTAHAADGPALKSALGALGAQLGGPDVLVYNAAVIQADRLGDLSPEQHLHAWAVNVVGAITAADHVSKKMAEARRGTILITGGMPNPLPEVASLSLGKAGVRALTELMAAQYGPLGIHVATVTVAGAVAPDTPFDPDDIAEHYWRLHNQSPEEWKREVLFSGDGS